jgi:hypothetical protein
MMVFEYNVITGQSYRWDDTPMEKDVRNSTLLKKQKLDNLINSIYVYTKSRAHI